MFKQAPSRKARHKPRDGEKDTPVQAGNARPGGLAGVPRYLQTAVTAGAAGGAAEREADRIAESLVQVAATGPSAPRSTPGAQTPADVPDSVRQTVAQPGLTLDAATRSMMESGVDFDYGQVRVHRDGRAAQSVQEMGARAYTLGRDVVFGENAYAPHTREGQRLIAHELVHVAQQHGRAPVIQKEALPGVPAAERRSLMITSRADELPAEWIRERFAVPPGGGEPSSRGSLDSDIAVRFAPPLDTALPDNIRVGLTTVAAHELENITVRGRDGGPSFHPLAVGRTLELNLALAAYGGQDGRYRFTHTARTSGSEILIELVGTIPADAPPEPTPAGGRFSVGSSQFELVNTWSESDFALLREAIRQLPPAALAAADGLRFARMTGSALGGEDGRYRPASDTVELFMETFGAAGHRTGAAAARTTVGGRRAGVWTILHEIGHALDLRPLAPVSSRFEQARDDFNHAVEEYNGLLDDFLGDVSAEQIEAARQRMLAAQQAMEQARVALTQPRSQTNRRWAFDDPADPNSRYAEVEGDLAHPSDFQQAATQDGVAPDARGLATPEGTTATLAGGISSYANTDWGELYAESFALYSLDPELLERTRPHIHEYFASRYPHVSTAGGSTP